MRIGIIGSGNMAEALIKIFIKNRVLSGPNISVYDKDGERLNYLAGTFDVIPCGDLDGVVQDCQMLFFCVSGQALPKVITNVNLLLKTYKPLVVSLTRGKSLEEIEDLMDFITPMARIVTNLNIGVGAGISAYCFNELVSDEQKGTLVELFSTTGQFVEIEERFFDAFAAVSTTASAFVCELIYNLTVCGVEAGLTKELAMKTAVQNIYGTMKTMSDTGIDTTEFLGKLCPPSSMTVSAIKELTASGFSAAIFNGFDAALENGN